MRSITLTTVPPHEAVGPHFQIIDVRSPQEYAQAHVPGALSRPLLCDSERAEVGVSYREEGAKAARMTALRLIAPGLPAYLAGLAGIAEEGRRLVIMCWRGGERSRNVVMLLALIGVHSLQALGGYKGYRRWVIDSLENWTPPCPVFTLYGYTGSGKSALLRAVRAVDIQGGPKPWAVDLEDLALHRGSLLGGLNQPGTRSQKEFDALLWDELRLGAGDYLILEGESVKIGRMVLPASVAAAVRTGLPVLVRSGVEARTERILGEYDPTSWRQDDRRAFAGGLAMIAERMAAEVVRSLSQAFDSGRFAEVARGLLVHYYDPLYHRSCVADRDFVITIDSTSDPDKDGRALISQIEMFLQRTTTVPRA